MAMIDKKPKSREDVDYWRSMVDVVLGILLVVLLSMSLLMLGFMDQPLLEEGAEYILVEASPSPTVTATPTPTPSPSPTPTQVPAPTPIPYIYIGGDDGARQRDDGGGGLYPATPTPSPTPSPTPRSTEDEKSAVLVRTFDRDTDRALKMSGVAFEVSDSTKTRMSYTVYYPKHVEYDQFETTKQGDFYLPEKLAPGRYTLHNIKVPKDYDLAANVGFVVTKGKDWDDPILVDVHLSPCKNTIALEATDADTGEGVPGGVYTVTAVSDVVSSDGTVHYRAGEVVQSVSCDDRGRARTDPLYLGTFSVEQDEIPFGYARTDMGQTLTLDKRRSGYTVNASMRKTAMLITVRDELTLARVAQVPFTLSSEGQMKSDMTSDGNGEIRLTNLEKNRNYSFTMKEAVNGYRLNDALYEFSVDADGLINGEAQAEMTVDVRKIRCEFSAQSAIVSTPIVGHDMGLFDSNGTVIEQWYSKEEPQLIEGLAPGAYILTTDGKTTRITIQDTASRQSFKARVWQREDISTVIVAAAILIGLITVLAVIRRRKKDEPSAGRPRR